jgi:homoserine O-acetyltransferase
MKGIAFLLLFFAAGAIALQAQDQQFARIGDFKLENGGILRDCVVGYRTFGKMNSAKSNLVVFPTFFGGSTADLGSFIGTGKIVDSSVYYVIAVDALADGVSSSPSNSKLQPRMQFPQITIGDMVNAEHKLLVNSLHLAHVHAILGISMGGFQAFQWAVSWPDFMDKVVSVEGSPQSTSWDVLLWRSERLAITNDPAWNKGQYTGAPKLKAFVGFFSLAFETPEYIVKNESITDVEKSFADPHWPMDANDTIRQIEAMLHQDVAAPFAGSLPRAAAAIHAPILAIVNRQDHVVNPTSSIELMKLAKGKLVLLDSACGHRAFDCEQSAIAQAVSQFLSE